MICIAILGVGGGTPGIGRLACADGGRGTAIDCKLFGTGRPATPIYSTFRRGNAVRGQAA
jgi:hypothetical protein